MMSANNPDLLSGGDGPKGAEEDREYNRKFLEMQQYIPFLETMIQRLERSSDKSREAQLSKMKSLYAILSNSKRKLKIETLQRCEDVLKKLMNKTPSQAAKAANVDGVGSTAAAAAKTSTDAEADKCDLGDAVVSSTTLEGESAVSDIMLTLKMAAARTRNKEAGSPAKNVAHKPASINQEESQVSSSQKSNSSLKSLIVLEQSRERLKKLMDQDPNSSPLTLEPDLDQCEKEVPWEHCTSPLSEGSDSIDDDLLFQKVVRAELERNKLKTDKSGKKSKMCEKLKLLAKEEENSWSGDTVLMKPHSRHSEDDDMSRSSSHTIIGSVISPEHSVSDENLQSVRQKPSCEGLSTSPSNAVPSQSYLPLTISPKPVLAERDASPKENKVIEVMKDGPMTPKSLRAKLEQEIHKVHRVGVSTGGALRGLVGKDSLKTGKSEGKVVDSEKSSPSRSFPPLKFLEGLDRLPSKDDKTKDSPSKTNADIKVTRPTDPRRRPSLDRSPSPSRTVRNMSISPPSPIRKVQANRSLGGLKPFQLDLPHSGADKAPGSGDVKSTMCALPLPPGVVQLPNSNSGPDAAKSILAKMSPQELQRIVTLNLRHLPDPPPITQEILDSVKGSQISPMNSGNMPFSPPIPESPFPPPSPAESFHSVGFTSPRDMYGQSMQPQQPFGRPVAPREDPRISAGNNHRPIPVPNPTNYDSRFNTPQMQLSGYPAPTGPISHVGRPGAMDSRGGGTYGVDARMNMPMSPLPEGQAELHRQQLSGGVAFHQQPGHGLSQGQGNRWAGTPCYGILSQPREPLISQAPSNFNRSMNVYHPQSQQQQVEYGQFHGVRDLDPRPPHGPVSREQFSPNSHSQWAMHDGSPPIRGSYKLNMGYQRLQGRDSRYPEPSNTYPGVRPNFSTPGSTGPRGPTNVRVPGPQVGRNTSTLSERDPRRRSMDEADNDKRPFARDDRRLSRPRDPRSSTYETNRDRRQDSAERKKNVETRRHNSGERRDQDKDRDSDSSCKRYSKEKTETNKNATSLVSPLNSLYDMGCMPKTGKGYGFQNFRIPKIKRDPPPQPKSPLRPPSPKDDTDDPSTVDKDNKEESNKTSKDENKTENKMNEEENESTEEQLQDVTPKAKEDVTPKAKEDVTPKAKEDVTQEWIEALIRKSFESGEGKKLFEHAQFLENLSESLKAKKFKKIKRILESDSDDSGSDKTNKGEDETVNVQKESEDDDDFGKKNKKSSKVLVESEEEGEITKKEKGKSKATPEGPKGKGRPRKEGAEPDVAVKGIEEERPLATENDDSKPHKKHSKRRSGLEILQADVRDMFISQGVITNSGKRICRIFNNAEPGTSLDEMSRSEAKRMQEEAAGEESDTSSMMDKKKTESEVSEDKTDTKLTSKSKGKKKLDKKDDNKNEKKSEKKLAKGWVMEEYEDASAEEVEGEKEDVVDVVKRRGRKSKGIIIEDSSTEGDKSCDASPVRFRGKQGKKQPLARRVSEAGSEKELRRRPMPRVILERLDVTSSNEELSSDEYSTDIFYRSEAKKKTTTATRGVARRGRRGASNDAGRKPRRARSASKDGQFGEAQKQFPDVSYEIFVPKESFRYKSNRKRVNAPPLLSLDEIINELLKGTSKCTLDELFPGKRKAREEPTSPTTNKQDMNFESGNTKFILNEIVGKQGPIKDDKSCVNKSLMDDSCHEGSGIKKEVAKTKIEEADRLTLFKTVTTGADEAKPNSSEQRTDSNGTNGDTSKATKASMSEDTLPTLKETVNTESYSAGSKEAAISSGLEETDSRNEQPSKDVSSPESAPIKLNLVRKAQKRTKKKRAKWQLGIIKKKAVHKSKAETDGMTKLGEEEEKEDETEGDNEANERTVEEIGIVTEKMDTDGEVECNDSLGKGKTAEDIQEAEETEGNKDTALSTEEVATSGVERKDEDKNGEMDSKKELTKVLVKQKGEKSDLLLVEAEAQKNQNLADISYVFDHLAKRSICKLCPQNRYAKGIVQHYKTFHPDSEVLISRLPVDEACRAISQSQERKYDRDRAHDEGTQSNKRKTPGHFACRMCNHTSIYALNFYEHMSAHTGEYRYQCCKCPYVAATRTTFKGHFYNHHPQIKLKQGLSFRLLAEGPSNSTKTLFGYLCSSCNFIQLEKENLEKHISLRHINETPAVKSICINLSKVTDDKTPGKSDDIDGESLAGDSEANDNVVEHSSVDNNSEDGGSKIATGIIDNNMDKKEQAPAVVEESVDKGIAGTEEDNIVSTNDNELCEESSSEVEKLPPKNAPMEAFICLSDVEFDDTNVEEERSLKMQEIDKILNITSILVQPSEDENNFLSAVINKLNSSPSTIVEVPGENEVSQENSPALKVSLEGEDLDAVNKSDLLNDSSVLVDEQRAIEAVQAVTSSLNVESDKSDKEKERNVRERRQRNAARKIAELSAIAGKIGIVSPAKINPDELGDRRVTRSLSKTEEGGESDSDFESDSSSCFEITDDDSDVEFLSSGPDANGAEDAIPLPAFLQDVVQSLMPKIKLEQLSTPTKDDKIVSPSEKNEPEGRLLSQESPSSVNTIPLTGSTISVNSFDAPSLETDDTLPLSGMLTLSSLNSTRTVPLTSDNVSLLHSRDETMPVNGDARSDVSDDTISLGENLISQETVGTIPLSGDDTFSLSDNLGCEDTMPVIGSVVSLHNDAMSESNDEVDASDCYNANDSALSLESDTKVPSPVLKATSKPPPTNPLKVHRPNISVVKKSCALIKVGCLEASKYNRTVVYSCKKSGCIFCSSRLDLFEKHVMSTHLHITWDGMCRSCDAQVMEANGSGTDGGHPLWFALDHMVKAHLENKLAVLQEADKATTVAGSPTEETMLPSGCSLVAAVEGEDASNDSTASTEPRKYIRMRRLSGDMLSVPKEPEDAESTIPPESEDSALSLQAVDTMDSTLDNDDDCPFLKIESVVSLNPNAPGNESIDNPFNLIGTSEVDISPGKGSGDIPAAADPSLQDASLNSVYRGFRRIAPALASPTSDTTTVTLTSSQMDGYRSVIVTKQRTCYSAANKAVGGPAFKTSLSFPPTKTQKRFIPIPLVTGKRPSTITAVPSLVSSGPSQAVETVAASKSVLKSSTLPSSLKDLTHMVRPLSSGLSKENSSQLHIAGNLWSKKGCPAVLSKASLLTIVQDDVPKPGIGSEITMGISSMVPETVACQSNIPESGITASTNLPGTVITTPTMIADTGIPAPTAISKTVLESVAGSSTVAPSSHQTKQLSASPTSDVLLKQFSSKGSSNSSSKFMNRAMLAFEFAKDLKHPETYQEMLRPDKLRHLYKCMGWPCAFSTDVAAKFEEHCQQVMDQMQKMKLNTGSASKCQAILSALQKRDWMHCCYCSLQLTSPQQLVFHIQAEHGHNLYQCAYCFFRARSHSYVVLHQNTCHTSQRVSVLLCSKPKDLPPPVSAEKPLAEVVSIYICNQGNCGELFLVPKAFQRHLEVAHNQLTCYYCHICMAHCFKPGKLLAHYKLHSYCLYQCRYCTHGTDTKEEMQHHLCKCHLNEPAVMLMRAHRTSDSIKGIDFKSLQVIDFEEGSELEGLIQPPSPSEIPDDSSHDNDNDFWKHFNKDSAGYGDNVIDDVPPSLRDPPQDKDSAGYGDNVIDDDPPSLRDPSQDEDSAGYGDNVIDDVLPSLRDPPQIDILPVDPLPPDPVEASLPTGTSDPVEATGLEMSPLEGLSRTMSEESETAARSEHNGNDEIMVVDLDAETEKTMAPFVNEDDEDEILIIAEKEPPKRVPTFPRVRKPSVISLSDDEVTVIEPPPINPLSSSTIINIEDILQQTTGGIGVPPELPRYTDTNSLSQTEKEMLVDNQDSRPKIPLNTTAYDSSMFSQKEDRFLGSILQEPMVTLKHRNPLTRDLIANAVDPLQMNSPDKSALDIPMVMVKHHNPLAGEMLATAIDLLGVESGSAVEDTDISLDNRDTPESDSLNTHCDTEPEHDLLPQSNTSAVATEDDVSATSSASHTALEAAVSLSMIAIASTPCTENTVVQNYLNNDGTDKPTSMMPKASTINATDGVVEKELLSKSAPEQAKGIEEEANTDIDCESESISARLRTLLQEEQTMDDERTEGPNKPESNKVPVESEALLVKDTTGGGDVVTKPFVEGSGTEGGTSITVEDLEGTGLSGEELYRCGNVSCTFSAVDAGLLRDHLLICDFSRDSAGLSCIHCQRQFKLVNSLLEHLRLHGIWRYGCALCAFRAPVPQQVVKHLKTKHRVTSTRIVPLDPRTTDTNTAMFVLFPKLDEEFMRDDDIMSFTDEVLFHEDINETVMCAHDVASLEDEPANEANKGVQIALKDKVKGKGSKGSTDPRNKTIYSPEEANLLPKKYVVLNPMACSICTFKTKVVGNMRRHLLLHDPLGLALEELEVPTCESVNPVPCLDKKEMMFDKMTNLAASSHASGRMGGKPAQVATADGKAAEEEVKLPKFVPENQRYVCGAPGCTYLTCDETMLRYHLRALHFDETAYRCPHCPESMQQDSAGLAISIDRLGAHLRMHDSRLYKCVHCPYNHFQRHVVERHLSDKHPEKRPFVQVVREPEGEAAVAGKGDSPVKLDASGSVVSGVVQPTKHPWRCGLCKFRCATRAEVIEHAAAAHNIKSQFKCGLCSYRSSSRPNFDTHFSSKHPGSGTEIVHVYRRVEETTIGGSVAGTTPAGSSSENPSPSTKVSIFDTTPIWRRDMYRVKHIRGILLEDEEESRRYMLEEARKVRPTESRDPLEEKFGPYGKPAPGNLFVCTRCNKYKTKFKSDMKEHLFRELEYMRWVCTHCGQMSSSKSHLQKHSAKAHDKDRKPEAIAPLKPDLDMDQWVDKLLTTQLNIMRNMVEVQPAASSSDVLTNPGPSGVTTLPGPSRVVAVATLDSDLDDGPPTKRRSVESWDVMEPKTRLMLVAGDTSPPKLGEEADEDNEDMEIDVVDDVKKKGGGAVATATTAATATVVDTKDFKYTCKHCGTKFQASRGFKIHIRHAHIRLGGWLCGYCPVSTISELSMKQHCQSAHPDLPEQVIHNDMAAGVKLDDEYWQREYGIVPLSKSSPAAPLDDSSPVKKKRKIQASDAAVAGNTVSQAAPDDATAVVRDPKQKCSYCSYHCKYPNDLRNHEMRHWVQKPFKCGYCDFEAIREYEIKKHCARTHPLKKARVIDKPMPPKPDIKPLRWTKRQPETSVEASSTVSDLESSHSTPEKKPREELKTPPAENMNPNPANEEPPSEGSTTSSRIFRCFYCPLRATSLSTVHEHWQNIHKVKFVCSNGTAKQGLPFRYKEVNVDDYRLFKKKSSYVCVHCKRRGTLEAITLHHREAHPDKKFKAIPGSMTQYRCGVCQFLACTVHTLRKHFEIEHSGEEFRYVIKPANIQEEPSEQLSDTSDKTKVSEDSPQQTVPTEVSPPPVPARLLCFWCDEACDKEEDMQLHHARYHSHLQLKFLAEKTPAGEEVEKKPKKVKTVSKFRCPKCSYSSNTYQKIFEHLRRHTKPFKCGYCPLSFSFPTKVRVHSTMAHPDLQVSIICMKEAEAEMKILKSQIITFDEIEEVFEDPSVDTASDSTDLPTEPAPLQRSISVARKSTTLSSVIHSGKRKFLSVARKSTNSFPRLRFCQKIPSEITSSPSSSRSESPTDLEEFSYYGQKPVFGDLTRVTTMMKYGKTMLNVKFPTVCQILNLNPVVRLVDLKNQGFMPF